MTTVNAKYRVSEIKAAMANVLAPDEKNPTAKTMMPVDSRLYTLVRVPSEVDLGPRERTDLLPMTSAITLNSTEPDVWSRLQIGTEVTLSLVL